MIKPTPTPAPTVENKKLLVIPYAYAAALMLLAVWQLVMFEKFVPALGGYIGTGVTSEVSLVAITLIGIEVFSMPFLLRLSLSPLARAASAGLAFLTPLAWATVVIFGQGLHVGYVVLAVLFFAWGGASFWVLGGPKVMRVKLA